MANRNYTPKYRMYVSKADGCIKIETNSKLAIANKEEIPVEDAVVFNDTFFVSDNRKALKEKAKVLLQEWAKEHIEALAKIMETESKLKIK